MVMLNDKTFTVQTQLSVFLFNPQFMLTVRLLKSSDRRKLDPSRYNYTKDTFYANRYSLRISQYTLFFKVF